MSSRHAARRTRFIMTFAAVRASGTGPIDGALVPANRGVVQRDAYDIAAWLLKNTEKGEGGSRVCFLHTNILFTR